MRMSKVLWNAENPKIWDNQTGSKVREKGVKMGKYVQYTRHLYLKSLSRPSHITLEWVAVLAGKLLYSSSESISLVSYSDKS